TDAALHPQSVSLRRCDVGRHLRVARSRRRRPRRSRDRPRLLRGPPGEVVDYEVDDSGDDYAPSVSRAPRAESMAGRAGPVTGQARGPRVSTAAELKAELSA